ncbi:MAG: Zn-binding domain-containing protein, partial [Gemmatimonadota bacterium]
GYLPEERREIERRLFSGELVGVSTTAALELGIDVGTLEACIIVGYPGRRASFFQQGGRAGRGRGDALVVLVGLDTTVNQYVMQHPEYLFDRGVEEAVIDTDNPFVAAGHLRCAAHELPVAPEETAAFGAHAETVLAVLEENGKVHRLDGRWYHSAPEVPQHEVSLRSYADQTVTVEDAATGQTIGQLDKFDAEPLVHPGAVYMHRGDTYVVEELDLEHNAARVRRQEVDYYTQPLGGTDIHHVDHRLREKPFGTGRAYWGEVTAYFGTVGYEKIHFYTLDALSRHDLELPTLQLETMAFWLEPPEALMEEARRRGLDPFNGLRGIGYAARQLLPLFMTCDVLDFSHTVGSVNSPWHSVFVYERYAHGLGFTEKAYERLHEILPRVLEHLRQCPCADGCPVCVGKPLRQYTTWNVERGEASIPSKQAALFILEGYLGDGSALDRPDVDALADDGEARRVRLQRELRRRLERGREPAVFHPIRPRAEIRTEYPTPEQEATLPTPDAERRAERRRQLERDDEAAKARDRVLHRRIGERLRGDRARAVPEVAPEAPAREGGERLPPPPVTLGDSLAARARRRARQADRDGDDPAGGDRASGR